MVDVNSPSKPSYLGRLSGMSGPAAAFSKRGAASRRPLPLDGSLPAASTADLYVDLGRPWAGANIPGLDGLRAISILLVMVSHSGLQNVVPGVFGVTIFFFISGFLITSLLLAEYETTKAISIKRFYLRRILRLYPPLLVYIAAMSAIWAARGFSTDVTGLLGALFYFANYLFAVWPEHVAVYGAHLWSLSVEEHFYLVFPLLFVLGVGRNRIVLCFLIAAALVIRIIETHFGASETYTTVATECRFDTILSGCVTAMVVNGRGADRLVRLAVHPMAVIIALCAILSTLVIRDPTFRQTLRFTIQNAALVPIVLSAVFTPRYLAAKTMLNWRPVKWIGVLSYSLYLWHYAVFDLARAALGEAPALIQYGIGWLLAFCVALLIYFLVERPVFKLRRLAGSKAHEQIAGSVSAMDR
jgi:peptidoglycan/LPS O-acetylase OafA/YrhL